MQCVTVVERKLKRKFVYSADGLWSCISAVASPLPPFWWCYLMNQDHFCTILSDTNLISFLYIAMPFQ